MLEALEQNFKRFQGWLNTHAIERGTEFILRKKDGNAECVVKE